MTAPTVTVFRSLPQLFLRILLLPIGVAGVALAFVGIGSILFAATGAAALLCVLCLAVMAVTGRPRIVITADGFTFHKLFGSVACHWQDIDGPFTVIKIGFSESVAYKLTTEYKARTGKKPVPNLPGYDDAIIGVFDISMTRLAELLNSHRVYKPA